MDIVSDVKDIWYFMVPLVALVAWSVRLEAMTKSTCADTAHLKTKLEEITTRLESLSDRLILTERATGIHSSMLKPENLEKHYVEATHFQTKTDFRLKALEAHVEALQRNERNRNA